MRKIFEFLFLIYMAIGSHAFSQEQVLYLSTNESGNSMGTIFDNDAFNTFMNNQERINIGGVRDGRGVLSSSNVDLSLFDDIEMVVIITLFGRISPEWLAQIELKMLNDPNLVFVIFADGCCEVSTNLGALFNIVDQGTNWNASIQIPMIGATINSYLNTDSLYKDSFVDEGLDMIVGSHYSLMNNVPVNNVLYMPKALLHK